MRETVVVYSQHAACMARFEFARRHKVGKQIFTIERLAARLAGGFLDPLTMADTLHALEAVIAEGNLGEFTGMRDLPGLRSALAATLQQAWNAELDFAQLGRRATPDQRTRFATFAQLERDVLRRIRPCARRPAELVALAFERLAEAPQMLGPLTIAAHTEIDPVWRPLLAALAGVVPVTWQAGPRVVPAWLTPLSQITVERSAAARPNISAVGCASPRHEALEALRWVRELLVSGRAHPAEIALAAAAPGPWDEHLATIADESSIRLHFIHGRRFLNTVAGQLLCVAAELILNGATTARLIRFVTLAAQLDPRFAVCDPHWWLAVPERANLSTTARWLAYFETVTEPKIQVMATCLQPLLREIAHGPTAAAEIGTAILPATLHVAWRQLLARGPLHGAQAELQRMSTAQQADASAAETAVTWGSAADLAAAPRRFVWLLGLNSRSWPRQAGEDPLLPEHYVAQAIFNPLPVHAADRRDFATIFATTETAIVCSYARRSADGKSLSKSPLLPHGIVIEQLRFADPPRMAVHGPDRLLARNAEAATVPHIARATATWRAWQQSEFTAHDGAFPAAHPLLLRTLGRIQSATSLQLLLRSPLDFIWRYGFDWREPQPGLVGLQLPADIYGTLIHAVLERTVHGLSAGEQLDLHAVPAPALERAVHAALEALQAEYELAGMLPPRVIWQAVRAQIQTLAEAVLRLPLPALPAQRSLVETPFGGSSGVLNIVELDMQIRGRMDRIDLAEGAETVRVIDYKTGRKPFGTPQLIDPVLIQSAIYAYVVRLLFPAVRSVAVAAIYSRAIAEGVAPIVEIPALDGVVPQIIAALRIAQTAVAAGRLVPSLLHSPDFALALPSNFTGGYYARKTAAFAAAAGELQALWENRFADATA